MKRPRLVAAALLVLAPPPSGGGEAALGRLLLTPAQRQLLDRERQAGGADAGVRCDGLMLRSDGRRVRWINGVAGPDREMPLRVGESLLAARGEAQDLVPAGGIVVRPPRAAAGGR